MESGLIVSSTDRAFITALVRAREALEPGTWASAALEAGLEASLGDGRLRFLMLRGFNLLPVEGPDVDERGGAIIENKRKDNESLEKS